MQFQCFVCGIILNTYKEFKSHIIEKHEESREYLLCPLKHCLAPVRDMRIHFKNKHPGIDLPKSIQVRATIWNDFSTGKKKVHFKEGYFLSQKNNAPVHYRSSYEETVCKCLEKKQDVISYEVEPFYIPYFFSGKQRKYYPDLKVNFADGTVELWEIKPASQTNSPMNIAKWRFCEDYCLVRGWKFKVIPEMLIEKLKKEVYSS